MREFDINPYQRTACGALSLDDMAGMCGGYKAEEPPTNEVTAMVNDMSSVITEKLGAERDAELKVVSVSRQVCASYQVTSACICIVHQHTTPFVHDFIV